MSRESPTLAEVFRSVLSYLSGRPDAVLFGSQAVNAYVETPRMTADIDIMCTGAESLVHDLRDRLAEEFHIATRVRTVAQGLGFRLYQVRRPPERNRHLVNVRQVTELPRIERIEGIQVVAPADLVILKLANLAARPHTDKGISDRLDLHRMLLAFPSFRSSSGPVEQQLRETSPELLTVWRELVSEPIERADEDEY